MHFVLGQLFASFRTVGVWPGSGADNTCHGWRPNKVVAWHSTQPENERNTPAQIIPFSKSVERTEIAASSSVPIAHHIQVIGHGTLWWHSTLSRISKRFRDFKDKTFSTNGNSSNHAMPWTGSRQMTKQTNVIIYDVFTSFAAAIFRTLHSIM